MAKQRTQKKRRTNSRAKIVTLVNQKGGVGKTTLVFHFAKAAAEMGMLVLIIDLDTQGNVSQFLTGNLDIKKILTGGSGLLFEKDVLPHDAPEVTEHEGISLLHGHQALDHWDNNVEAESRVFAPEFRDMLRSLPFDLIIVDTPPAVGVRQLAPLAWSDLIVIPMEPAQAAVVGFQDVLESIKQTEALNPDVDWIGVLNKLDRRSKSHREMEAWLQHEYKKKMSPTLTARAAVVDAMQLIPARPVWRGIKVEKQVKDLWFELCTKLVA